MSDFTNIAVIIERYKNAVSDLGMSKVAKIKEDKQSFQKHKRDAGEALSQTIEFALKNHLYSIGEKTLAQLKNCDIKQLIKCYIDPNGTTYPPYKKTLKGINPDNVDFLFILNNKAELTNLAKHQGDEPDFEIQLKYLEEIRKFIKTYLFEKPELAGLESMERVDLSGWDLFYTSCDRFFKSERNYILITGKASQVNDELMQKLAYPEWDLILDMDYDSRDNGFYSKVYSYKEKTPHIFKPSDTIDQSKFSRYAKVPYYFFIKSYAGSGEALITDYLDWIRKYGVRIETFIKNFASAFFNQKTVIVLMNINSIELRYIKYLCEKLSQYFSEQISFVFANNNADFLEDVAKEYKGILINISMAEIAAGFTNYSSNYGIQEDGNKSYLLPYLENSGFDDVTGVLSEEFFEQLQEDFEVLYKGVENNQRSLGLKDIDDRRQYLCGETMISWYGLKNHYDVERKNFFKKYVRPVEKLLVSAGRGKIFLFHEAGFGGTTIARRIAWELHEDHPTLILKKYRDEKIKESIVRLHQITKKTILVVLEIPQTITFDDVDTLFNSIPQARPVVFLIVKRGSPSSAISTLTVPDWGNDIADLILPYVSYLDEYTDSSIRSTKKKQLNELVDLVDPFYKTPFYVGLVTFEEKFIALKEYIKKFVDEVIEKPEQKKILIYLAIADYYLGVALPAVIFKSVLRMNDKANIFNLERYFGRNSPIINSLLRGYVEGNQKYWKMRHYFFSKSFLRQILSGNSVNPELWKTGLTDQCVNFIFDTNDGSEMNMFSQDFLQKLFIGSRKDRAGEAFTEIINDLPTRTDKERVFVALIENYPDNPHFFSHLARFYAYHEKNWEKAFEYATEAIRLSEMLNMQDSLLHHIKGMCYRARVYDIIEAHIRASKAKLEINEIEYRFVLDELIPSAAKEFQISRELAKKQNRIDEHGFIAHVQMLIRAIDYGIALSGKSASDFFKENKEPFMGWIDLAESLLEEVKRTNMNDDESGKIEKCQSELMPFYASYDTLIQNLRNQLATSQNPSRTRRHIVRAYIRRPKDYRKDIHTINNILTLMEENIENEPNNERNYYLWFQAARYSQITLNEAISKMARWKVVGNAKDSVYYLYILKVLRALDGYSDAAIEANALINECKINSRYNITTFEWLGRGVDLNRVVSRTDMTDGNKEEKLERVKGYFTEYLHNGSGKLKISDNLEVFFSPTQAKLTSNELNREVDFFLGFSYDGLRADSFSVRLI
jgi:hypothetical protein